MCSSDLVKRYNEELKNNKTVALDFKFDFNEKITYQDVLVSQSTLLNIGYFFLQQIYHDLKIGTFFKNIIKDTRIQFDPNLISPGGYCAKRYFMPFKSAPVFGAAL